MHPGAAIEQKLMALRQFVSTCPPGLHGARVFRYGGADLLETFDIPMADVGGQIAGAMGTGRSVDWVYRNALLYLRVFESGQQPPSWERVFAQHDLADVRALLGDDAAGGQPT